MCIREALREIKTMRVRSRSGAACLLLIVRARHQTRYALNMRHPKQFSPGDVAESGATAAVDHPANGAAIASQPRSTLRAIAVFEGIKGFAALGASLGFLRLAHHDLRHLAYALIGHFHLDPDSAYPQRLLQLAELLSNTNLRVVVLLAWAYAALRLTECIGLWRGRAWAEWLTALSGALYVPIEINHVQTHATFTNWAILAVNVVMVTYMIRRRWVQRRS